jgi:aldehyde dehydrogenase (NAD+)
MFGPDVSKSDAFGRIVDQRHFERLAALIDPAKTVIGGTHSLKDLFISPTVLYPVSFSDPVMQEEIFGPILPVIPYSDIDDVIRQLKSLPKPLALYVFTKSVKDQDKVFSSVSFGGGCINDAVMHIANPYLPFGGVGPSGNGRYHGRSGILEFSNQKSVMNKATWIDPFIRYPPFTAFKEKILRKLL